MIRNFKVLPITILLGCLQVAGVCAATEAQNPQPPNILLILIDDLGYADLGAYGDAQVNTPNLDALANEGVRFTRFYTDSTCSPSRAALLTGLHPARLGYNPNGRGISNDVNTLPRLLNDFGYSTHHVGKWHIGHISPQAWPDKAGFDSWFGFLSQWLLQQPAPAPYRDGIFLKPTYFDPWLIEDRMPAAQYKGHLNTILAQRTRQLITSLQQHEQPWFINHWLYLPHAPIEPDKAIAAKYADTPKGRYLAMVEQLDSSIGLLLKTLEETGQAENTLVVVASDNGGTNKQRNNNAPFFGKKSEYFEGGIRVPLLIRWPGKYPKGKVIDDVVSITDLTPTIIAAVKGRSFQGMDGVDLNNLITKGKALPGRQLFWESSFFDIPRFSVLSADGRWRLTTTGPPYMTIDDSVLESGHVFLNDLDADPTGSVNVVRQFPEIYKKLQASYAQWFKDVHQLEVNYKRQNNQGRAIISGQDMLRTPGFGGFSYAIAVRGLNTASPLERLSLTEQPNVWSVEYDPLMRSIFVNLGGYRLSGYLPDDTACHSIILSSYFLRKLNHWGASSDVIGSLLYINGKVSDDLSVNGYIPSDRFLHEPTYIGGRGQSTNAFSGEYERPLFFNLTVSPRNFLKPEDLHQSLCSSTTKPLMLAEKRQP